ncbi:sigma-70 family RNA polymerase sigma factor [Asanoa sp. NPDC049573]|uniref:RNA polymerase sigma factor n=1 Tax=Asanoa sp. NPDC049573 TaxID=3155396 RepID=UPI0034188583
MPVEIVPPRSEVFDAVYVVHYPPLVRLAYVTTGSMPAAEDIVQDAFVEWLRRYDDVESPVPYLRRAVVSRCTSWIRRRVVERRHALLIGHPPAEPSVVASPDRDAVAVRSALARISPRQRSAVFLRFYLDLSVPEIGEALDCPSGTVKSLLHRAMAVLHRHLGDFDDA